MQHTNTIKLLILLLKCLCTLSVGVYNALSNSQSFCYEGKSCGPNSDAWGGQCKTGKNQSPIDLPFILNPMLQRVSLDFNEHYLNDEFRILNNEHTVRVTLPKDQRPKAQMYGSGLRCGYIFAEIHFHWGYNASTGSEHSVNKKFYAMEAHLVHYDPKYSDFEDAANSSDPSAVAVLGVFIAEGSEQQRNSGFDTIAEHIPESKNNETLVQQEMNLLSFLPKSGQIFYRYNGSLTTPTCKEIVVWTVVKNVIYVKPSLIQKFRDLTQIGANYRPIQERSSRAVKYFAKK